MSRAGKFIPGGSSRKTTALGAPGSGKTGPIRAPSAPGTEPPSGGKRSFKGSGLTKPVAKGQRLPIVLMSALVCCLLFAAAYYFAYLPEVRRAAEADQRTQAIQKQLADTVAAQQKAQADLLKQQSSARATLMVDSKPSGANVTIGDFHKQTPAVFNEIVPGTVTILIQADGFRDYKQDVTVTADKPVDLGTIDLGQKVGNLSLSSSQPDVTYTLTGPGDFKRDGQLPDNIQNLPIGSYQLIVRQHDWKLQPITVVIHDQENAQKDIKFPFASLTINSVPPGANVRVGHTLLGKTPLSLPQFRPGNVNLSVDLAPYTVQHIALSVPEFGNISKEVSLTKDKDFVAASGIAMVWIPDGYWAGKYEVRQSEFETVAGYNPSFFRKANKPVESISWEAAASFCDKLTQYERKAGRLPNGYRYALPTESQWSTFSADADIDQAVMSRSGISLSSTQEVGSSEPNKYGLYDTLGNVWEWCSDVDDRGNHSVRGGSWLSSTENFPSADTRNVVAPKYADHFTGFRVVLIPN